MRIVVFSDSHRNYKAIQAVYEKHPEADVFIHLGDGEHEFRVLTGENPDHRLKLCVRGNNDMASEAEATGCLKLGKIKILYTHGHLLGVCGGLGPLEELARASKANIVLFGHTHEALNIYRKGLYIFNPGSISQPRDFGGPSYGIIDLTDQGIHCSIVRERRGI